MRRSVLTLLCLILSSLLLAACGGSGEKDPQPNKASVPYPHNFEPFMEVQTAGPKTVAAGSQVTIKFVVTNTSKVDLETNDTTVGLMESPDDTSPFDSTKIVKYSPSVSFEKSFRVGNDWLTGALLAGQSKTYRLTVRVPQIPNSASRFCYHAVIGMSSPASVDGWSGKTGPSSCANVKR